MRADFGRGFENTGAQTLAAHLHQAERRNAPDLNTCAVIGERTLHRLFDFTDVSVIFHVDKVDDDQAGHIAQTQLTRDFVRGFEVGAHGSGFNAVLAGRAA